MKQFINPMTLLITAVNAEATRLNVAGIETRKKLTAKITVIDPLTAASQLQEELGVAEDASLATVLMLSTDATSKVVGLALADDEGDWMGAAMDPIVAVGNFRIARPDFGFVGDVFCHVNNKASELTMDELDGQTVACVCTTGAKGKKATSFKTLAEVTEDDTEIVRYLKQMATRQAKWLVCGVLHNKASSIRDMYRKQAKIDALKALGIDSVKKEVLDYRTSYGGKREYRYSFDKAIDEGTFKKFLELEGEQLENRNGNYFPDRIDWGEVPFSNGKQWLYCFLGGWDD